MAVERGTRGAGGSPYAKQPPGLTQLSRNAAAQKRQEAGLNPSVSPLEAAKSLLKTVTASPPDYITIDGKRRKVVSGTVFTPVTAAIDALRHLPEQIPAARDTARKIAHPSAQNPASLGQNIEGLLGGSFGLPAMAVHAKPVAAVKPEKPYEPRTIRHNDLEVQAFKPRSRAARAVLPLIDKASAELQKTKHVADLPGVRLLTTGERVVKAAGRAQRAGRPRALAPVAWHLKELKRVKPGSDTDVAHFWYAQMPKQYRNAEGLRLVRDRQAEHLDYLTSGRALEDLARQEQAIRGQMAEAVDAKDKLPFLRDLEEIRIERTDIPRQAEDVAASIGRLEKLIPDAPAADDRIITAIHGLGDARAPILVEAGRLDPKNADARKGLVSRWLGVDASGEEAYLGHRLAEPENSRYPFTPTGGTGRVKSPQGVGSENKLTLARTGRLRQSVHVAGEDWQAAQTFREASQARNDLAQVGTRFTGQVPAGSTLVNPKAATIPKTWRNEEFAAFRDGPDGVDDIRRQAEEVLSTFMADPDKPGDWQRIVDQALEQGIRTEDLRVVPTRLVDRYYAQYRGTRGRVKVWDSAVDAVATSIVFARLGYIPKNWVQGLLMAAPHQGPMILVNAVRGWQALLDHDLRPYVLAEIGGGSTGAIAREASKAKGALSKFAGGVAQVADDPVRVTALMHELAAEGVISKTNPLLSETDKQAMIRLFTDKTKRPLLNDVSARTREAMGDFTRMTPDQARLARRLLIVPGWLMAGTRYPFHFAATHPVRSALLAYIAMGEPGAPDELHFNHPLNEYFHGEGSRQGIDTPVGRLRTGSLLPYTTPWELALGVKGSVEGKSNPYDFTTATAFDFANPLAASAIAALKGEGLGRSGRRLVPGLDFLYQEATGPRESATYPDSSRFGLLKRELGVVPIPVNDPGDGGGGSSRRRGGYGSRPGGSGSPYARRRGSGSPYGR